MKKLSFRVKLVLGLGLIIFFSIGIILLANYEIRNITKRTNQIYNHPFIVSNSVRDINTHINRMQHLVKEIILSEDEETIDSMNTELKTLGIQVHDLFHKVHDRYLGDRKDVENAYDYYKRCETMRNEIVRLKRSGKEEEAGTLFRQKCEEYSKEYKVLSKVIADFAQHQADIFLEMTRKTQKRSELIFIIVASLLLLLSMLIAYFISNSISKPIRKFVSDIKQIFHDENIPVAELERISETRLLETTVDELRSMYNEMHESNKQLKTFNESLEQSVKRRTKEIQENEKVLKKKNEEYQALNEEYQAQNEELIESLERIQKINKELEKAKVKAEESDKLKSAFIANMSHEIRTPMNGIIGFTQMLVEEDLPEEKKEYYAKVIIDSSHRLLSTVNDILDISRIESGTMKITKEQVYLNELMMSLYSFFKPKFDDSVISFQVVNGLENRESIIYTDPKKLHQILNNLLSNAFKYTSRGDISFGYEKTDHELRFFVKDSGIGIEKKEHENIFEHFRQAQLELKNHPGGTGLGLSISKKLVELLGGRIWVESEPDKGSVFYFTLPFAEKSEKEKQVEEEKQDFKFTESTILIAEDEEINYLYLNEILQEENIKTIRVKNGKEAVEMCEKNPDIQLVLMDIKMPVMDGYEATRLIKKTRPELPVIAQTAYAMAEDRDKSLQASCDDYLIKPIDKTELLNMISKYIGNR